MFITYLRHNLIIYLLCSLFRVMQSSILYGGILGEHIDEVDHNHPDVAEVIQFAKEKARKYESLVANNGLNSEPDILGIHKEKLHYTVNGATRYVKKEYLIEKGKQKIQTKRAIVGLNYRLALSWSNSSYFHELLITKDRAHRLFIFQHTFYETNSRICINSSSEINKASKTTDDHITIIDQSSSLGDGHVVPSSKSFSSILRKNPLSLGDGCHKSESYLNSHWKVPSTEAQRHLQILSYNIWNFNSFENNPNYYVRRMNQLGILVAGSQSDIIGFQEVRFDQLNGKELGPAQVQHLANYLPGYQFVYQPAVSYFSQDLVRVEEGLAIFSKHPIVAHDYILLSRNFSDADDSVHQRICLRAEIIIPDIGAVHVFVTHLSLSASARLRSVLEIWNYISAVKGPAILLGDFNDEPHSKPIQFLSGKTDINGVWTSELKDAWRVFYKEPRPDTPGVYQGNEKRDDGLTFNRLDKHLRKRIDYIFVRLPKHLEIKDISLLNDEQWNRKASSDHVAVQATIKEASPG
ncbi:uncharacterized protein [Antedon mediterranea]|uniref:uncharacterized protein n=1 Tax=Antedon mediterranea TaxID=105859 RepID=UPI003AF47509